MNSLEPLRWGVLSTALICTKMVQGAAGTDLADVRSIASRDRDRASATAWSIPTGFASYENLLVDDSIEAVYVPLPNGLNHLWTMRALEADKHVLCEMPYSRHAHEVSEGFELHTRVASCHPRGVHLPLSLPDSAAT